MQLHTTTHPCSLHRFPRPETPAGEKYYRLHSCTGTSKVTSTGTAHPAYRWALQHACTQLQPVVLAETVDACACLAQEPVHSVENCLLAGPDAVSRGELACPAVAVQPG